MTTIDNSYLQTIPNLLVKQNAFDAASMDYKNQMREAQLGDADYLAMDEHQLIVARSRHVCRNNGIINAAETKFVAKLKGIQIHWQKPDGQDHDEMNSLWQEFWKNPMLDGYGDGNSMQATWNHDRFQSGEAIARMVVSKSEARIPLKIQNIESEYLDIGYTGANSTDENVKKNTRYGMTFDPKTNKPTKYHFLSNHYYGLRPRDEITWELTTVDARDICHIFERRRSNQWRGLPMITAILQDVYGLQDLSDATIAKQTAAAAISWIIERPNSGMPLSAPGSVNLGLDKSLNDKLFFLATGGQVQYTNPGERFQLVQSADIGNGLVSMLNHVMQTIASNLGLPYYMLSGDTSGLNFSSIRAILLEFKDYLEYIHNFITIPHGLSKIADRFQRMAVALNYAVSDAIPSYRYPKDYGIDDLKDNQANVLAMQSGGTTLKRVLASNNITVDEFKEDILLRKELGLEGLINSTKNQTQNNSQAKTDSTSN